MCYEKDIRFVITLAIYRATRSKFVENPKYYSAETIKPPLTRTINLLVIIYQTNVYRSESLLSIVTSPRLHLFFTSCKYMAYILVLICVHQSWVNVYRFLLKCCRDMHVYLDMHYCKIGECPSIFYFRMLFPVAIHWIGILSLVSLSI